MGPADEGGGKEAVYAAGLDGDDFRCKPGHREQGSLPAPEPPGGEGGVSEARGSAPKTASIIGLKL